MWFFSLSGIRGSVGNSVSRNVGQKRNKRRAGFYDDGCGDQEPGRTPGALGPHERKSEHWFYTCPSQVSRRRLLLKHPKIKIPPFRFVLRWGFSFLFHVVSLECRIYPEFCARFFRISLFFLVIKQDKESKFGFICYVFKALNQKNIKQKLQERQLFVEHSSVI